MVCAPLSYDIVMRCAWSTDDSLLSENLCLRRDKYCRPVLQVCMRARMALKWRRPSPWWSGSSTSMQLPRKVM